MIPILTPDNNYKYNCDTDNRKLIVAVLLLSNNNNYNTEFNCNNNYNT